MTKTEQEAVRKLENKGYETLLRDEITGTFGPVGHNKLSRKEAVAVAKAYREAGYRARCIGPNPYDFPFRIMIKLKEVK